METKNNENSLFSSLLHDVYPLSDFLIRMDMFCILAIHEKTPVYLYTRRNWEQMFPLLGNSREMEMAYSRYYAGERNILESISKGRHQSNRCVIKALSVVTVILVISEQKTEEISRKQILSGVVEHLKDVVFSKRILREDTETVLSGYFIQEDSVTHETFMILNKYHEQIQKVYNFLRSALNNETNSDDMSKEKQNAVQCTLSPLRFIRMVCLLYLALEERETTRKSRQKCIQAKWQYIFENENCIMSELDDTIRSDELLKKLNMLFEYQLRELKSGLIVRQICLSLCVNAVISRLPHHSDASLVVDESLLLFSKFSEMSAGYEKKDIENYVKRLTVSDGTIDREISAVLWKHSQTILGFLKKAIDYSNSHDHARLEDKREKMVDEHRKEINELKNQIYTSKANTIYQLIETLTDPSYNYVLDRLYRFAYGYDELSCEELKTHIKELIQVMRFFGANAFSEDLIDQTVTEELCSVQTIHFSDIPEMPENHVIFPGWEVCGDVVTNPIASKEKGV